MEKMGGRADRSATGDPLFLMQNSARVRHLLTSQMAGNVGSKRNKWKFTNNGARNYGLQA